MPLRITAPLRTTACLLLLLSAPIHADEVPADAADVRPAVGQILVMTSGKVVTGRMTPRPDGYDVVLPAGRMFVPSELVRFQASSLDEAYRKMRQSLPELTPGHHMELAQWCETNQLPQHAVRELLDALRLDPHRGDARRMLQSLLNQHPEIRKSLPGGVTAAAEQPGDGSGSGVTLFPSAEQQRQPGIETRSLGGFSRPLARSFVQSVQPLLVNKCASGGCHGGNDPVFPIISTRQGSTPLIAERNLAAVLRQIDLQQPQNSPLLAATAGSHGGSRTSIFQGRTGSTQIRILRDWVFSVCAELSPTSPAPATSPSPLAAQLAATPSPTGAAADVFSETSEDRLTTGRSTAPGRIQPVSGQTWSGDGAAAEYAGPDSQPVALLTAPAQLPHGEELSLQASDARILQEVRLMNRRDAFDPQIFNQKYHAPGPSSAANQQSAVKPTLPAGADLRR